VGNSIIIFKKLLLFINNNPNIKLHSTSPILINPPWGYEEQDDFYNATIFISTNMGAKQLLRYVLKLEINLRRIRMFPNAPRSIDIDIIEFNNKVISSKNLEIPHPRYKERYFVYYLMGFLKP